MTGDDALAVFDYAEQLAEELLGRPLEPALAEAVRLHAARFVTPRLDESAYRRAVLAASQLSDSKTPVTFDELLSQNAGRPDPKKPVTPGHVAEYSDPQTVAALAQRAAQSALGRNLTAQEVTAYVKEFHAAEQQWNANAKAAAGTAAAGTDVAVTTRPSAETAAAAYVQRGSRGTEATGNNLSDYVNVLRQLVGGDV